MTNRKPTLDRATSMRLAATEYERCSDLLASLDGTDWTARTECPAWDVRQMAAHMLGMVELAASIRECIRQSRAATVDGAFDLDRLTDLQVRERADWSGARIARRYAERSPAAARARRRSPWFVRRRAVPPTAVNGVPEPWTMGYLFDTILTRDPWTHRIDIARALDREPLLTAEHDGVLVADVVTEWAQRHGRPVELRLTGPAGGSWTFGTGGPHLELDAIDFCRAVSGRRANVAPASVMDTQVAV